MGLIGADAEGDEGPVFFAGGFAADVEGVEVGLEPDTVRGFGADTGFDAAIALLTGFVASLAVFIFGADRPDPIFGDAAFGTGISLGGVRFADEVAVPGVRGDDEADFALLLIGGDPAAVESPRGASPFCCSIDSRERLFALRSDTSAGSSTPFISPFCKGALGVECRADFAGLFNSFSLGFPNSGPAPGALEPGIEASILVTAAARFDAGSVESVVIAVLGCPAPLSSKGDPFSIEPRPDV